MFNKHNEGVRNFWLRTFGDKELALHDRSYCTIFTNSSEHVLALHELSLVSTPLVNTFEELCAMTKEATRRLPADITSSQDKPIPTAEGPETGCLLFWVNMVDRRFFPAKCVNTHRRSLPAVSHRLYRHCCLLCPGASVLVKTWWEKRSTSTPLSQAKPRR